jgi:hypothetical protein
MAVQKRTYKTTKVISGKPRKFRSWDDYTIGDVIVARYIGESNNQFNADKPNYTIEIIEAFLKDKNFEKELIPGTHLGLNTTGMLEKAMKDVEPGTLLQITYNGKNVIATGKFAGKESHVIEVAECEEEDGSPIMDQDEIDELEMDL